MKLENLQQSNTPHQRLAAQPRFNLQVHILFSRELSGENTVHVVHKK
jgi:hypothetical protein